MNYPTLKSIFWENDFRLEADPDIAEIIRCANGYLNKLVKRKHLSDPEAERLADIVEELSDVSKAAGFEQGFHLAVKLFIEN